MLCAPVCMSRADMEGFVHIFEGVADPRRSNATLRDPDGMPMIGLLSALRSGEGCADMERFGRAGEGFPRGFMRLAHGIPSHDAFSNPFNALNPGGLQRAMPRLGRPDWAVGWWPSTAGRCAGRLPLRRRGPRCIWCRRRRSPARRVRCWGRYGSRTGRTGLRRCRHCWRCWRRRGGS